MIIKESDISCSICSEIADIPLNCYYCDNIFCKGCYEIEKRKSNQCPFCKKIINFIPNDTLREIVNLKTFKCKKCNKEISQKDLSKHEMICREYKCKICNGKFKNYDEFFNHLKEEIHQNILILKMNKNNKKEIFTEELNQKIKELIETRKQLEQLEEEINKKKSQELEETYDDSNEIHKFVNIVSNVEKNPEYSISDNKIDEYSSIQIPISPGQKFIKDDFMDLYFCKKKRSFECTCQYKICAPSCCLCKECMKINKEYHKLNEDYLINKAGRTAFCRDGKFHCLYQYQCKEKKNQNFFIHNRICRPESFCESCKDLNINADKYLSEKILKDLNFVKFIEEKKEKKDSDEEINTDKNK